MSKRPNERKSEMNQGQAEELRELRSTMSETAERLKRNAEELDALRGAQQKQEEPPDSQKVLGRSGDEERGRPVAVDLGFQPIPSANIPAALAALWRAMVALPAGHPALRSLAKCEAANPDDAVPRLKMCAAALRLMHLNASAEHVEKAAELLTGGSRCRVGRLGDDLKQMAVQHPDQFF